MKKNLGNRISLRFINIDKFPGNIMKKMEETEKKIQDTEDKVVQTQIIMGNLIESKY
jgi:hypothetical protein